jgi:orotidine-5'-phosphate decarboxylase
MAAMSQTFLAKLKDAAKQNNSLLCVGLDPDPALMPIEEVIEFNTNIIKATSDLVCAYKPNLAFYEALGEAGYEALRATLAAIPPEIPVIADAKRGDIGNTAAAYARAVFDVLGCDAMTVNAYGGKDSLEPVLEYANKGVLIWCRSSNPSAIDLQDLEVDDKGVRRTLWETVAVRAAEWNKRGNVGLVVGATYPAQLARAREICPEMPILVPGIGQQEGSLREAVLAGLTKERDGVIISASRSILYASRDSDYAMGARAAAAQMRDHIERYRQERTVPAEA